MTMQVFARDPAGIAPETTGRPPALSGRPARTYLMCPPAHFAVEYAINPWMDPSTPIDRDRAMAEWERLRATYVSLGHTVHLLEPVEHLPDMVFAANGATVVGGMVMGARFRHPERGGEAEAHRRWFESHGYPRYTPAVHVNEGEGDYVYAYRAIVAGHGFRTDPRAHNELHDAFGLPVVSVALVDPRFYHLDTALCVIDSFTAAYYPGAFDDDGLLKIRTLFPELIEATEEDALAFGLNAVSDGRHVVVPHDAVHLRAELTQRDYDVIPVEMTELRKAGGGPKCCTLELRP
ncbi:dimethylargininase [Actinoallomurus iriomotensis]|uniref:Amidinotransferase n=1 Tax=Actinoallomurus iriomotensis TaxID=478107 RepID=A0A9W6RCL1_9ACTN|nr:dimethylargininase [Actinoallomurus iriomotensis]GLY73243.1 amidinotransferase [Actinoallomurus iriomotensis]